MNTYVIHRRSGWASPEELEIAAGRSARVIHEEMSDRVRWIRSYIVSAPDGRLGTVCVYQASDVESVREHARRADLPADEILPVTQAVILSEDPVQVS